MTNILTETLTVGREVRQDHSTRLCWRERGTASNTVTVLCHLNISSWLLASAVPEVRAAQGGAGPEEESKPRRWGCHLGPRGKGPTLRRQDTWVSTTTKQREKAGPLFLVTQRTQQHTALPQVVFLGDRDLGLKRGAVKVTPLWAALKTATFRGRF